MVLWSVQIGVINVLVSILDKRAKWIAATAHKNWEPKEHTWVFSDHFISGAKNNPLSHDYAPSIYFHTKRAIKQRIEG